MLPDSLRFPRALFLSSSSAFLYILAYNEPKIFWPLAFVAFVPFLFFVYREENIRRVFYYGLLFGVTTMGGVIAWFWNAYPLDWAGIESSLASVAVIFLFWLLSASVLGIFIALWAVMFKKLATGGWRDIFIAPSLWILSEFARAVVFSLVYWAKNASVIGPYWTLGFFGNVFSWSKILALFAPWGGVYLLSFLGLAVNCVLFILARKFFNSKRILAAGVCVAIILIIFPKIDSAISGTTSSGETKTIAVITTDFSAAPARGLAGILTEMSAKKETIEKLLSAASLAKPDIIVLPSDSRALDYLGAEKIKKIIGNPQKKVLLIDSAPADGESGAKETMFFYETPSGKTGTYDKMFLLPNGEYLPYFEAAAIRLFGRDEWVRNFDFSRGYHRGAGLTAYRFDGNSIGALLCSEIIPYSLYRGVTAAGAGLLVNVFSQAIFHGNGVLYNQMVSLAKMRAEENRRYFAASGNFAPSFIINDRGDVVAETKKGENVFAGTVRFNYEKTVYTRFGDWVLVIAAVIVAAAYGKRRFFV